MGEDPKIATTFGLREASSIVEFQRWDTKLHRGRWKGNFGGPNSGRGATTETEGSVNVRTAFSTHLQNECASLRSVANGVPAFTQVFRNDSIQPTIQDYTTEIQEQPPKAKRVNNGNLSAPYSVWKMESRYKSDQHVVQCPIAKFRDDSPVSALLSDTAKFIALAPPTTSMVVRCDAVRVKAKPDLPKGESFLDPETGISYQLLDYKILSRPSDQRPGGDLEYSSSVELIYGLNRAPQPDEELLIVSPTGS